MPTHTWRAISLGYEMRNPPNVRNLAKAIAAGAAAADGLREKLERDFDCAALLRWKDGHHTDLGFNCDGDTWVAKVLEKELNQGLRQGLRPFSISERHLLYLRPEPSRTIAAAPTSDWPGTTCKLIDGRWVNGRSYEIDAPIDDWGDPHNVLLIATLTWPCPGTEEDAAACAELTAKAARSQGAGKPAGAAGSTAKTKRRRT